MEIIIEYDDSKYKYKNGKWLDCDTYVYAPVAVSAKLDRLAKNKLERVKLLEEAKEYVSGKDFTEALKIYRELNEEELYNQTLLLKIQADKDTRKRIEYILECFKIDIGKYTGFDKEISADEYEDELREEFEDRNFNYVYRNIRKDEGFLFYDLGEIESAYPKRNSETGVWYLFDYYPNSIKNYANRFEDAIRRRVFGLKDFGKFKDAKWCEDAVINVAVEFYLCFEKKYKDKEKITLACVPASKTYKTTALATCIAYITRLNPFKYKDGSKLLFRDSDVNSASKSGHGKRPTYEEQYNSIDVAYNDPDRFNDLVIILDDITTTGLQMEVCRDILVDNGYKEKNIDMFAFAKTKHW